MLQIETNRIIKVAGHTPLACLALVTITLVLGGCSMLMGGMPANRETATYGGGILKGLRPAADPALVESIREKELKDAQAAQTTIASETAGAQMMQPGLGRNLPNVSTDPISGVSTQSTANGTIFAATNQEQVNNAFANQSNQMATYENAYNTVPPPPPGSLAAGLVPPPPAITLSTQAQTYAGGSAAEFYNNPYFNPYGVPAPPQAQAPMPERRPSGLFGEGGSHNESQYKEPAPKHRADFVPITPIGMESRSPYKQRDDLRILWRAAFKSSGDGITNNKHLMDALAKLDVGLPTDSSRGCFNVSARQIDNLFKSSSIDKRALPEIHKMQADLVQAYYRYLFAYNKYALAEQTTAARQQEVDLSESDLERQKGTADLAQAKNDLDSAKDDMHSAEIELASATSPMAARTVISHVAGVAPSIESLAQGSQNSSRFGLTHSNKIASVFDSVFKHNHSSEESETISDDTASENPKNIHQDKSKKSVVNDSNKNKSKKIMANDTGDDESFLTKLFSSKNSKTSSHRKDTSSEKISQNSSEDNSDLNPSPSPKKTKPMDNDEIAAEPTEPIRKVETSNNSPINFQLKGIDIKPRKSVLTVAIKNSSSEAFELNADAISISEGNHKIALADMRADFDITSIQPDHEVKGTITVFGHPWNDRLLVYLNNGNKKIQLKR